MSNLNLERWYRAMKSRDPALLDALLHDEAVFTSPVVHTPQRGKAITKAYLTAASEVLTQDFRYVREFDCGDKAGFLEATIAFALSRDDLAPAVRAIIKNYAGV